MDKKKIRKKIIYLIIFILATIFVYVILEGCGDVTYSYPALIYACGDFTLFILNITDPIVDYLVFDIFRDPTTSSTISKIVTIFISFIITTFVYLIIIFIKYFIKKRKQENPEK